MSDMAVDIIPRKITVAEYHRMAETGILRDDERVELLDGTIYEMSPIGRVHWALHWSIVEYLTKRLDERAMVVGQGSLPLGEFSEPEPDIMILPRLPTEYFVRDPQPAEVYALIEVAGSSLRKDIGLKRALYGKFAIREYVVVDLEAGVLLRYRSATDSGYAEPERLGRGERFRFEAMPEVVLDVERFLPPPGVTGE